MNIGCNRYIVRYSDTNAIEAINTDFGSADLQMIATKLAGSLINSQHLKIKFETTGESPVITVAKLRNYTSEHIDTVSIMDKISTALMKTGKVRFRPIIICKKIYIANI